ncbi:class F sortase [Allostreptomyces psammosilenae]|uniref:Sortase family protein n=1 Tax=Allostreptomyces psammosilenae TaxID=1892865 RepID=A0A852ZU28_9ACTN|nr:class F sortase [Allostreptomyces psammosilenae]NYI04790.1 hypothetical protein [Allostreptomyces psammosilenae]
MIRRTTAAGRTAALAGLGLALVAPQAFGGAPTAPPEPGTPTGAPAPLTGAAGTAPAAPVPQGGWASLWAPPPPAAPAPAVPVRVAVPGVVAPAAVRPVAVGPGGAMEVPARESTVGWWALGAAPGADRGTVVLVGHVDTPTSPRGVFAELYRVTEGTPVTVTALDGRVFDYRVRERELHPSDALPAEVFATDGPAALVLITCAGTYDHQRGRYPQTLVVRAVPAA